MFYFTELLLLSCFVYPAILELADSEAVKQFVDSDEHSVVGQL